MKKLLILTTLILLGFIGFSQNSCSGSITLASVPLRTTTTLTDGLRIGDGGSGVIKVCLENHTIGKCGGNKPTLYFFMDDGSGLDVSALVENWDMTVTPDGTCYTLNLCNEYLYLKRPNSCINNDGSPTMISWTYMDYTGGAYRDRCTNAVLTPTASLDCAEPTQICMTGVYPGNASGSGIQEFGCAAPSGNNSGCLQLGENNSAWYTFTAIADGTFTFQIEPSTNNDDYDFAIFGPNPDCSNLGSPVRCNYALNKGVTGLNTTATWTSENGGCVSGPGCTNTGFSSQMNILAGETYLLLVDGFASATDPDYTLTIGGTASLECVVLALPYESDTSKYVKIDLNKDEVIERTPYMIYSITGRLLWEIGNDKSLINHYHGIYVILFDNGDRERRIK
jgi:hypothetical protein